ncbi:MAG: YfiR family protein [Thermoanaerobaculia bacterium]
MIRRALFAAALLFVVFSISAQTAAPIAEYQLKAAFVLNFIEFTKWPESAFVTRDAPYVLCVIGVDPFGSTIDDMVEGETFDRRKVTIRRIATGSDVRGCHLAYIARSESKRLDEILAATDRAPLLTVSDIDQFVRHGGTIGLFLDRNRVRFEIGLTDARRRHLKLGSQLLTLGSAVR